MTGKLLLHGMIAGMLAGIIAFSFAHTFGEPQVDRAISSEEDHAQKQVSEEGGHHHEGEADGDVLSAKRSPVQGY